MKSITRCSLALSMFFLFSILYLVTSATAQSSTTPAGTPGMPPTGIAPKGTPDSVGIAGWIKGGLKALGIGSEPDVNPAGKAGADALGAAGMPPTGVAPEGTPGTPSTGLAPEGTLGTPPTGVK